MHGRIFWAMALVMIFSLTRGFSQTTAELPVASIVDTVRCAGDPSQSYALFLPPGYDSEKQWPILYVFEPAARGRLPLEHFKLASETHGVILVASNNSRNGSWSKSFKAAQAVFDDTWGRFSIDTGRVYAAGFSGGARVATALAINSGRIAGVIACGAGFPTVAEYQPQPNMPFVWIGVVGNRDMNYLEVHKIRDQITEMKGRAHVLEFDGRHVWPAGDTLLMAMDLLQLEAGKGEESAKRLRKRATDLSQAGRLYDAGKYLQLLCQSFPEDFGAEDGARAASWLDQKEAGKQKKEREKILKWEEEYQRKHTEQFIIDLSYPDDSGSMQFWKEEGSMLAKLQRHSSEEKARMADRLINQLWVRCYEMGQRAFGDEDFRTAATYFLIWSCVLPESIFAHYSAARSYARLEKRKFALSHLENAIRNGMQDPARLDIEDFSELKETRTFRKLKARIDSKGNQKSE